MDHIITGIEKLSQFIHEPGQLQKLQAGARLHKRHSRITFEVLNYTSGMLLVSVTQGHHPAKNYFSIARLEAIGKEMFTPFIPSGVQVTVEARPYDPDIA